MPYSLEGELKEVYSMYYISYILQSKFSYINSLVDLYSGGVQCSTYRSSLV